MSILRAAAPRLHRIGAHRIGAHRVGAHRIGHLGAAWLREEVSSDLGRLPIALDLRAVSIQEGLRAALSTAVIVALNHWIHWPPMMEAALAALLTCLCDSGGTLGRRVPAVLAFGITGTLVTVAVGAARAAGPAVLLPLCFALIFCAGLIRVHGPQAQQVGTILCVTTVLAADHPLPDAAAAWTLGASFLGGSLWAAVLTLLLWRIHPDMPARRAVANVYRRLAVLARDLLGLLLHPDRSLADRTAAADRDWEGHARGHRRAVRDAIEAARDLSLATMQGRAAVRNRAARTLIRLETADQIFAALIALSELLEKPEPATAIRARRMLRRLAPLLMVMGRQIAADTLEGSQRMEQAITAIAADVASIPAAHPLHRVADALVERLRIAATLASPAGAAPAGPIGAAPPIPAWSRLWTPIRANLDWNSAALRHALRAAVAVAVGLGITLLWQGIYQHWLTITVVVTLQPYFALTIARALERIGGTVLGGALAAVIALVCHGALATALALFPLAVIALSLRAVSFALFITFLTPLVVLLSELGLPGSSEFAIAAMRALYTVAGGLLAVAACLVLWPSWEPDRLAAELRAALRAHADYAAAEIGAALGEVQEHAADDARRAAGIASNNLEASVQRRLFEPGRDARDGIEAVLVVDAALRRMAGRLAAMQMLPELAQQLKPEAWHAWRGWIAQALESLARGTGAAGFGPRPAPAAGAAGEAFSRIARQIELMAGAMDRMAAAAEAPSAAPAPHAMVGA